MGRLTSKLTERLTCKLVTSLTPKPTECTVVVGRFDAVDDHLEFPVNGPDFATDWRLTWIMNTPRTKDNGIFGTSSLDWYVLIQSDGRIRIRTPLTGFTDIPGATVGYAANTWATFSLIWDQSTTTLSLEVDSVEVWNDPAYAETGAWDALAVGTIRNSVVSAPFDGYIKDVEFVQNGSTVGYWPVNDDSGNSDGSLIADQSGNGNDGILDNDDESTFWERLPCEGIPSLSIGSMEIGSSFIIG